MRIITRKIVEQSSRLSDPWKKYLKRNSRGWFDWMLDMGMAIAWKGMEMDWQDLTDESQRPPYMRKRFLRCWCKKCFHCKNKLTGRYGPPKKAAVLVTPKKRSAKQKQPSLTKRAKRGRIVEIAHEHLRPGQKRVQIFPNARACSICMKEKRKKKPKAGAIDGVKYIHNTYLGCPHLNCREHPVCDEHWEKFKHF